MRTCAGPSAMQEVAKRGGARVHMMHDAAGIYECHRRLRS